MGRVVVAGTGLIPFGKYPEQSLAPMSVDGGAQRRWQTPRHRCATSARSTSATPPPAC